MPLDQEFDKKIESPTFENCESPDHITIPKPDDFNEDKISLEKSTQKLAVA